MRLHLPSIDDEELEEIREVLASGYLTQGAKTQELEQAVAQLTGRKHAFAMSSCTTALHLSLVALGIGPGDEVLVADFTFPATANVVVQQGAKPVLVDIDLDTFTMDPDDLREKITCRSKAIIPVHAFGCSADMDPIVQIAKEHGLAIIEDAACAIGATYKERPCGGIGDLGCFSFHPRKVITTGEGGAIVTDRAELAERIQILRNHGGVRTGYWYRYEAAGFNYRLSDVLGALGVAQMRKLASLNAQKRTLAKKLRELVSEIPGVRPPTEPPWGGHIYQSFVILLDEGLDRDRIVGELRNRDIEATLGTYAIHAQPFYQREYGHAAGDVPRSHAAFRRTIALPFYAQMSEADLDLVAAVLREAIAAAPGRRVRRAGVGPRMEAE
jgi:dTDP-4-amino-4,6-dideoxygalactose transaminase